MPGGLVFTLNTHLISLVHSNRQHFASYMCYARLVAGEYCDRGVADSELMRFPNDISVLRLAPV